MVVSTHTISRCPRRLSKSRRVQVLLPNGIIRWTVPIRVILRTLLIQVITVSKDNSSMKRAHTEHSVSIRRTGHVLSVSNFLLPSCLTAVIHFVISAKIPDATQSDVTGPQWFKIYEDGLNPADQSWGVDRMIANKGKVTFSIPECIEPGQYLLRHELIGE